MVGNGKSNWDIHHGELNSELKPNGKLFPDHVPSVPYGLANLQEAMYGLSHILEPQEQSDYVW
jgi:hypothetical protein